MFNKKGIIALTIIVSLLCLYNLTFTFIARNIQQDATAMATNEQGQIDLGKKQKYLDSIYQEPVFNFLGLEYTYKQIKEKELSLGLDLQGGMHLVLEVSPVEILKNLAGTHSTDPQFVTAIQKAKDLQKTNQGNFTDLFYTTYSETTNGGSLGAIFNNAITRDKGISNVSTDADIKKMIDSEIDKSIKIAEDKIRLRVDKFAVTSPNIQRLPGTGRIQIELPGVENPKRVRNLLQGVAQLEFLKVYFNSEIGEPLQKVNDYLLTIEKTQKTTDTSSVAATTPSNSLFEDTTQVDNSKTDTSKAIAAATDSLKAKQDSAMAKVSSLFKMQKGPLTFDIKDTSKVNSILNMPKVKALLPAQMAFLWKKPNEKKKEEDIVLLELIPVKKERAGKALTGDVITEASVDSDPATGEIQVSMSMNNVGTTKWKNLTREASQQSEGGVNRRIAIVLDNVVYSDPQVKVEIPNGRSVISGNFNLQEANDLVTILNVGKLPAPVRIVEEVIIGPSLGKEAIAQGLNSMMAGMAVVIIFMIFYYSKGGFVADVALFFNILFILGVMANINAVLTLPGIAGMVLTIGMAVDANVLIFERIREELSLGKPLHTAIDLGYSKAFSSIFDSNVTTIITGILLWYFGSGPVKGFAVTLIIGLICSFFTSVYISKVIVLWITRKKDPNSLSFSTMLSRNLFKNLNFDFIGKRKIAYVLSGSLLIFGMATIFMQKGLNLGVDFKGGRSYVVQFQEPVAASDLKEKIAPEFKGASIETKAYGSNSKMKVTTSYLINDESKDADQLVENTLIAGLKKFKGDKFEIQSSTKVGATVADDIVWDASKAIIFSLIGIFLYVFVRFKKWQFSLGGVVALLHDALMVIGMFSILRLLGIPYEVDQVFVAAILTIVGFSINDTVIVFDRVREFMVEHPKASLGKVLNDAINSTLSRTIITTLTVLVVVLILLVFGGEALRGFSVAMLLGVVFGSYSTIFIAVPMVLDIRSKQDKETEAALASNTHKKVTA